MAKHQRKDDRLSSLPDAILINILSLLPTNTAAFTSVLSHRWRYLWTGVTRLDLILDDAPNLTDFLSNILLQLTSPKLHSFKIEFDSGAFLHDDDDPDADAVESCFHHICRRNVEQFIFIDTRVEEGHFRTPDSFLSCQSLVDLHLFGPLKFDYKSTQFYLPNLKKLSLINLGPLKFDYKSTQFYLPNLKKLSLINLSNVPDWVWSLHTFVPFLQDLTLVFETTSRLPPNVVSPLNLHFLNLKSLTLALIPGFIQVSIDAPELTHLVISGCVLPYTFRRIPTELIKACIELRREDKEEDENDYAEDFNWFSEFFRGMSSITNLGIVVFRSINIFSVLNLNPPMFFNVVRLEVTLDGSNFSGWNDLLVSLQCFPNLQHLWVKFDVMGFVDELVQTMWRSPDIVPSCLVNKLEMIKIIGLPLSGIAAGLMLLRYILCNAKVLRKLYFGAWFDEHSQAQELWKERKFCKSLFKLPRCSPTSKVVFSGRFITSSSNTFKKGKLTCKMT